MLRTSAIVFCGVGLFFLLRRIDFIAQVIPVATRGPEGGFIELWVDLVFGGGATLIGLVFAFIHFARARKSVFARLLAGWACLQLVGFIAFFVRDVIA